MTQINDTTSTGLLFEKLRHFNVHHRTAVERIRMEEFWKSFPRPVVGQI